MHFRGVVSTVSSVLLIAGLAATGSVAQAQEPFSEEPSPLISIFSAVPVDADGILDGEPGLRVVPNEQTALAVDITPDADIVGGVASAVSFSVTLPTGVRYASVVNDLNVGVTGSWRCTSESQTVSCRLADGSIPTGSLARAVLRLTGAQDLPGSFADIEATSNAVVTQLDGTTMQVEGATRYPVLAATAVPPMVVLRDRGRPQPISDRNVVSVGVTVLGPLVGSPPMRITGLSPRNSSGKTLRGNGFTCNAIAGTCTANDSFRRIGDVSSITTWFKIPTTREFATLPITNRYLDADRSEVRDVNSLTVARNEIPGPAFAVEWETGSGQGVMPGEILRVRTLVTNTVLATHTPTLRVVMPDGVTATPSSSAWSCQRSGAVTTCTRKSPLGPEEADLVSWRVRADINAEPGTVDLRAVVTPGSRSRSVAPITIGSFGDPVVGITVAQRQGDRWRTWNDGSTREIDVNGSGLFRASLHNVGGGTLRAGQRVTLTQEFGAGVADVQLDSNTGQCTFTENRWQCTLRVSKDVPPGNLIGRVIVQVKPDEPADRVDLGPLQARVLGSGSPFTESTIRFAAVAERLPLYIAIERVSTFTAGGGGEMFIRLVNEDQSPIDGIRLIGTLPAGMRLSPAVGSRNWSCDERVTASGGREVVCVFARILTSDRPQALLRMPLLVDFDARVGPATIVWRADALIPNQQTGTTSVTVGINPAATLNVTAHPAVVPAGSGNVSPVTLRSGLVTEGDQAWTHAWRQMCTTPVDTWPEICDGASSTPIQMKATATGETTAFIPQAPTRDQSYVFRVDVSDGSSAVETEYVRVTSTPPGNRGDITPATFAPGIDCPASASTCVGEVVIPQWLTDTIPMNITTAQATFTQDPATGSFSALVDLPSGLSLVAPGATVALTSAVLEISATDQVLVTASATGTYAGPGGSTVPVTVSISPTSDGGAVAFARATQTWSQAFGMAGLVATDVVVAFERKGGSDSITTSVSGAAALPDSLRTEFSMPDAPALIAGTADKTTLAVNSRGRTPAGDLGTVSAATIEILIDGGNYSLAMDARFLQQRVNVVAPLQVQPVAWQARENLGLTQLGNTLFGDVVLAVNVAEGQEPQITLAGDVDVFGVSQRLTGPMFLDEGGTPVATLNMGPTTLSVSGFDLRDLEVQITIVGGRDRSFSFGTGSLSTMVLGEAVTFDGLQFVFADNLIQRIFDVTEVDFNVGSDVQVDGNLRLNYLAQPDTLTIGGDMGLQTGEFTFTDAQILMQPTCATVSTRYRAQGLFTVNAALEGLISAGGECSSEPVVDTLPAGLVCLRSQVPTLAVGDARGPGDVFITNAITEDQPVDCWSVNGMADQVQGVAFASLLLGAENLDNTVATRTEFGPGVVTADALGIATYSSGADVTTKAIPGGTLRIAGFTLAKVDIVGTNTDGTLNLKGELAFFGNTINFTGSYRDDNGVPVTSLTAQQQNIRMFGFVAQGRDISLSQSRSGGSLSMGTSFSIKGIGSWSKRMTFVVNGSDIRFYASGQTTLSVPGISFGITLTFTNCTDSTCTAGTNAQLRGNGHFAFSSLSFNTGQFVIDPVSLFSMNLSASGSFSSSVSSGIFSASAWGNYSVTLVINADSFQASGSVSGGASAKAWIAKASISIGTSVSFNPLQFCISIIGRNICFSI